MGQTGYVSGVPDKITEFLLLGFQNPLFFNQMLFCLFLVFYVLTLVKNLLAKSQSLKSPMYFFLTQLTLSDIMLTTTISPNMLHVLINGGNTIYVTGCITQIYIHGTSTATEHFLLKVMSSDRYLAIFRPLHYIMDFRLQIQFFILCWILAFLVMLPVTFFIAKFQFCGPHVIDHYLCDLAPLIQLSWSDCTNIELVQIVVGIPSARCPFFFILFTYIYIFITIFGISSTTGRQKAFSICSSHMTVVSAFQGTLTAVYLFYSKGQTSTINKLISLIYSVGTPFLNPVICSLRNQEIKKILFKYILKGLEINQNYK